MNILPFLSTILKSLATTIALVVALGGHHAPLLPVATSTTPAQFPIASSTVKAVPTPTAAAEAGTKPLQASSSGQVTQQQTIAALPADQLNTQTRAALVNILCTVAGNQFEPISGSGVIIDSDGVILTNAHVGQFFLLRDYGAADNIDCVVRTGSPAEEMYHAELLYLPPQWVKDNASELKAQVATGTGQNDYAFLLITGTTNPQGTLPASFPHLSMDTSYPEIGQEMLLAAYPAGFLSGQMITEDLYASSAFAYVTQLFSFDSSPTHVDLFSIGGSVVSQSGSSGGAAVRMDGTLAGLITTDTTANSTGERDLRVITLSHINSSLATENEGGIAQLLTGDLAAEAADFNTNTAPQETQELEAVLEQ